MLKARGENVAGREGLCSVGLGHNFLEINTKAQARGQNRQTGSCGATVLLHNQGNKSEVTASEREEICPDHMPHKRLIFKIHKELKQLDKKANKLAKHNQRI